MAHIHADGVADTTTSTGTGNITADNTAPTGFRTFNDVCTDGDTFFYFIRHRTSQEWEAGLGTYVGSHEFGRTAIINSSDSNNAVDFTSGTKDVFISAIAGRDNPRLHGVPTDERIARFDGATGNLQSSSVGIDDSGNVTGVASIAVAAAGLKLRDTNDSHDLIVSAGSDLSADRTLTIETGDAARTLTLAGNATLTGSPIDQGLHTIWIPATAMVARTTNGAAAGTVETSTNKVMLKTLDFDTSTQEFAQFAIRMPKSWDEGTVAAAFTWSHPSTTTNFGVVWALEAVALSDDDAGDAAFGTAQTATDTGGTTNDIYVSPTTSALTIGGTPASEDWVVFQVKRVPSDGSDTMAVDARLHGVTLYLTLNAGTDA